MANVVYTKLDNLTKPIDYCQVLLRRKTRNAAANDSAVFKAYDYAIGMVYQIGAKKWEFHGATDEGRPITTNREQLQYDWDEFIYIGGMGDPA